MILNNIASRAKLIVYREPCDLIYILRYK